MPEHEVDAFFVEHIMGEAPFTAFPAAQDFCDYFTQTWLESTSRPISLWNQWNDCERTTNAVEGWHSKVNGSVIRAHPNVFDSISLIKREQESVELKTMQMANGARPPTKKRKYVTQENRLTRLRERLNASEVNLREYAEAVGNLFPMN